MSHRASYWKTTGIAFVLGACALAVISLAEATALPPMLALVIRCVLSLFAALAMLVACAGLVCLWRDAREAAGRPDFYARSATRIPVPGVLSRLGLRFLLGPRLRPGDVVRVRSMDEIAATLDGERALEGLPFMREMEAFCGKTFRVHRRIDKINDMRQKTGLRRMRDAVTLTAVRCTGVDHGNCQAECQILWKDRWLEKVAAPRAAAANSGMQTPRASRAEDSEPDANRSYVCQMTRLWEASSPMSRADIRQDLRPLLNGNVGPGAYLLAILTRLFNVAQTLRGGSGYPFMPPPAVTGHSPPSRVALSEHEAVVVRSKDEIARTLVNGRNRGLWFDRDMIRFCRQPGVVHRRVERVIHEGTGKMVVMKTPCVILEDGVATGEFLRLCPQHEYIFWREAWLRAKGQDAIDHSITNS